MKTKIPTQTRKIVNTTTVNSFTKSIKLKPAFAAMIIFGGSPINVAVPPIFDAKTSVIKNGTGSHSNSLAMTKVTGITKTTVVTLSKNADAIAVNAANAKRTVFGCPFVAFKIPIAIHLKTPLLLAI